MSDFRNGLDIADLYEVSDEEKRDYVLGGWTTRGPLYQVWLNSMFVDYTSPLRVKLHPHITQYIINGPGPDGRPSNPDLLIFSVHNLPSYLMYGWETGIYNESYVLWGYGMPMEAIMELIMFTQLYCGMRGLGHMYRAMGDFLPAWGPPTRQMEWPDGWEVDSGAFQAGLDLSTHELTSKDRANLESWYEQNIGYVPRSIEFGLKYQPEFLKLTRAKWEESIRTLPKQVAPYIMLKMNAVLQNPEGIREATLLCKAWGIKKKYVMELLNGVVYYFGGFESWYAPAASIEDVLDSMD